MTHLDGRQLTRSANHTTDVVIVGSGPAGASAARVLARSGARVRIIESGPWVQPADSPVSAFSAMAQAYRAMGASLAVGRAPIPLVQGRMVGGSSPINGAICWRLPRDIHDAWVRDDPALEAALPWRELETITDAVEARLGVAPTDPAIAGRKNALMARGAEALGLEHRPIRRNVRACRGSGRCMQGCPHGAKQSADRTLIPDALESGAELLSSGEVTSIERRDGRAIGVMCSTAGGARLRVRARSAVVLAASAIQTPGLLLGSGIRHGPVGRNFQCHPGVSLAGSFEEPVRMWEGATQGHEVIGLRREGLKFEALGMGLAILAGRLPGAGRPFARNIGNLAHHVDWGAAIRARATGRVRRMLGRTFVRFRPSEHDVRLFRRGLRVLGEMMLAAGASRVDLGVRGVAEPMRSPAELADFERNGPRDPAAYTVAITHMFGTCRMGSDPARSVVRPDFRHHATPGLYVADSSVFPTNIGVNPQIAIMALATLCGRRVAQRG